MSLRPSLLKLIVPTKVTFSGRSGSRMSRNISLFTETKDEMVSDVVGLMNVTKSRKTTKCIAISVSGKSSNKWSLITIRMGMPAAHIQFLYYSYCIIVYVIMFTALAIYSRSPAAFEALQDFNILQLPGVATLKSYIRSNKEAPGECAERLANERHHYNIKVQEHLQAGKRNPPLSEGALIADEVKVAAKLHWNSRDDSLVGHSMTPLELSTLQDLYRTLDDTKPQKADYVLQTLWRDHSSDCDIVGPYYTSSGPFKAKYLLACITNAIQQFHTFQFSVSLLIVDGSSSNLTMMKLLMGIHGVFGHKESQTDRHHIQAYVTNPFSGKKLYMMICPSHQVRKLFGDLPICYNKILPLFLVYHCS